MPLDALRWGNTATGVITGTGRIRGNPATGGMLRRVRSQTLFHSARTRRENYAGRRERRANYDQEGTRKVQVADFPPSKPTNPILYTAVASPHNVAQGK